MCEASESWEHSVSDKLVYLPKIINREDDLGSVIAKQYSRGDLWWEILISTKDSHIVAIVRIARNFHRTEVSDGSSRMDHLVRKGDIASDKNLPVLFNVIDLVKLPQSNGVEWDSCRSIVWLKRFDILDRPCIKTLKESHEPITTSLVGGTVLPDGKLSPIGIRKFQINQRPNGMVKRRSQILDDIGSNQKNIDVGVIDLDAVANGIVFRLIVGAYGVGLLKIVREGNEVSLDRFVEAIQVRLCPLGLPVSVC